MDVKIESKCHHHQTSNNGDNLITFFRAFFYEKLQLHTSGFTSKSDNTWKIKRHEFVHDNDHNGSNNAVDEDEEVDYKWR